jgi:hypothetical protein
MLIDRIEVSLEPSHFYGDKNTELRFRVRTMGQEFNSVEVLSQDDLQSNLDRYFDGMKYALKAAIQKQIDYQKEGTPDG